MNDETVIGQLVWCYDEYGRIDTGMAESVFVHNGIDCPATMARLQAPACERVLDGMVTTPVIGSKE